MVLNQGLTVIHTHLPEPNVVVSGAAAVRAASKLAEDARQTAKDLKDKGKDSKTATEREHSKAPKHSTPAVGTLLVQND